MKKTSGSVAAKNQRGSIALHSGICFTYCPLILNFALIFIFSVHAVKRKRGRPRKYKMEEQEGEETVSEPIVLVKEEEEYGVDRALEEFRAFFGEEEDDEEEEQPAVPPNLLRQDETGLYHCQV